MTYRPNYFSANGHSQPDYGRRDYDGRDGYGRSDRDIYAHNERLDRDDYDRRSRDIYASKRDDYDRHDPRQGNDILTYFRALAEHRMPIPDEIADVILEVVRERMNNVLADYGYKSDHGEHGGHYSDQHKRFKEVLEDLRNADQKETAKRIDEHFRDLRPEERKLLTILAQERSKKQIADSAGLPSVSRMLEIKRELENKLK